MTKVVAFFFSSIMSTFILFDTRFFPREGDCKYCVFVFDGIKGGLKFYYARTGHRFYLSAKIYHWLMKNRQQSFIYRSLTHEERKNYS